MIKIWLLFINEISDKMLNVGKIVVIYLFTILVQQCNKLSVNPFCYLNRLLSKQYALTLQVC